ncbi:MAG: sensor domain-containing diguanylate cyclase [Rhodocyclaceae bacterium]|nr:sensor domain-containing diguanylate cyclase [Rhodocyclaceae bacterium]MCB1964137.1 sensor domain-containing diguanylate cyclase [Rhodocyclaceae bacterium]
MTTPEEHYLKRELYTLFQHDAAAIDFVHAASSDGWWYRDLENPGHEWLSPAFWRLLGFDPAEKRHRVAERHAVMHPADLHASLRDFDAYIQAPDTPYDQVLRYRHKDGSTRWVRCRGLTIRTPDGRPVRVLGTHCDLTSAHAIEQERRDREALLRLHDELHAANARNIVQAKELERLNRALLALAVTDPLTRLNNRRAFETHYRQLIKTALRHGVTLSLLIVDVDHFKAVNDTYGHLAGDEVLQAVAAVLAEVVRESDCLARWGGEEFAIVLPHTDYPSALVMGERVRRAVHARRWSREPVTVSVGVSTFVPQHGQTDHTTVHDALIREADAALYAVKHHGRNRVMHFNDVPA